MFSTLQRPTLEELERRRAMRETRSKSPPLGRRSSTLQRRESFLSKGFNALFRRESMINKNNNNNNNNIYASHLNLRTGGPPPVNNGNRRLGRAMSFKYPERISQIPPPEITRIRSSKSQHSINDYYSSGSEYTGMPEPKPKFGNPVQRRQSYLPPRANVPFPKRRQRQSLFLAAEELFWNRDLEDENR